MYTTLKKQLPKLIDENNIEVIMNNSTQEEEFVSRVRNEMLAFLKKELNNSTLEIVTKQLDEESDSGGKIYTPEDKFEHMSKKNPNLQKLRQEFNLDFE